MVAQQAPPPPQMRDPEMIAPMVGYLASDDAWNINGYVFAVAGGSVSVLHHPTAMRTLWKPAMWTVDELAAMVPTQLLAGVPNTAFTEAIAFVFQAKDLERYTGHHVRLANQTI